VKADATFMRMAVRLARKGVGRTSPNPPVGAVVVKGGRVVGCGYHHRAGEPHAEILALAAAGSRARGATVYVTLEPCTHHGRTPPCADALIGAGIRRIVVGVRDPNRNVRGSGLETLARAGIEVSSGLEGKACADLIAAFARHANAGLPLVTLKLAASLDGRIATATGASRWITGEAARRWVHRMRNEVDAVMVGAGTVLADDPLLTCRLRGGRNPLRVIVDGALRIPLTARVLTNGAARGTLIATMDGDSPALGSLRRLGARVVKLPGSDGLFSLKRLLALLGKQGIMSVMIEGGATLAAAALREGVVDRLVCFLAPKLIGGDGLPMIAGLDVREPVGALPLKGLALTRVREDLMIRAALRTDDDE
jgi:diaminohydroxyphosphoribosylaminopyrimidine deaminase / 5-amino-6-(5-phosphoribosylamino)uracil reductase